MFPKIRVPQIIHFNRVFLYKPSILGIPLFLETPIYSHPMGFKRGWNCQAAMASGASMHQASLCVGEVPWGPIGGR